MSVNVFDLVARIALDSTDYRRQLDDAAKKTSSFGDKLKKGLATAGAIGSAAIGAATTAIAALSTAAVSGYAQNEQLVGGVNKLFGTASKKLQQYADEAYRTSGVSANQYMEQATSFSAALINSLGGDTEKAADLADVAIRAMSDNVNTFGSDMQSVRYAFQGFAKQNYTMLDNLKLGYGGTKTEMERLIADANEYRRANGEAADLSINSFADIVQAIQSVQEAQHIAGTTAKEAATTIQGSAGAVKAAWQNVLTAIGRGEGLSKAIEGLSSSLFGQDASTGLINNIIPVIKRAAEGIGDFVVSTAPMFMDKISELVSQVLPSLANSGTKLIASIAQAIADNSAALTKTVADTLITLVQSIAQQYPSFQKTGVQILKGIISGILSAIPELVKALPEIITGLVDGLLSFTTELVNAGIELFSQLVADIPGILEGIVVAIPKIIGGIGNAIINAGKGIFEAGTKLADGLMNGFKSKEDDLKKTSETLANKYVDAWNNVIKKAAPITGYGVGGGGGGSWGDSSGTGGGGSWGDSLEDMASRIKDKAEEAAEEEKKAIEQLDNNLKEATSSKSGASDYFSRRTKEIERQIKYQKLALDEQLALWEQFQKKYKKGSDEYLELQDRIFDTREKIWSEAFRKGKESIERQVKYEELELEQQISLYEKFQQNYSATSEEYIELEDKLFDLRKNLREKRQRDEETEAQNAYNQSIKLIEKRVKYEELSDNEQISLYKKLQEQLTEGSEQYAENQEKIFDLQYNARKKYLENIQKLEDDYQKQLIDKQRDLYNQYSLFDKTEHIEAEYGSDILESLQLQVSNLDKFSTRLQKLRERFAEIGVDEESTNRIVSAIEQGGVSKLGYLTGILNMTDKELNKLLELDARKYENAQTEAERQLKSFNDETFNEIQKNLQDISELYQEEAPEVGQTFTEKMAEGIEKGANVIIKAASDVAKKAMDAFRTEFSAGTQVNFSDSALGKTTSTLINSAAAGANINLTLKSELKLPDNRTVAEQYIEELIKVANFRGTPIANPIV